MTIRIFAILYFLLVLGCSNNPSLNGIIARNRGGLASVNVADFDRAPAKTPLASSDKAPDNVGIGKYDFSVDEVQFRESSFLSNGKQAPSVKLIARNRGYAPVSVSITFDRDMSENMTWDDSKSHISVVPPHSEMEVARFDPINKRSHGKLYWHNVWQIGDCRARHASPQHYRFPFPESAGAYAIVREDTDSTQYTRHAVMFTMPADTQVLAARNGIVVRINERNDVDIAHDDGTIATYEHIRELAAGIRVGKAVNAGDPLGLPGKTSVQASLQLAVWRPEAKAGGTLESYGRSGFQAVSFPLEFCSESQQCMELKKSQAVPQSSEHSATQAMSQTESAPAEQPVLQPVPSNTASPVSTNITTAKSGHGEYDFSLREEQIHSLSGNVTSADIIAENRGYAPVSIIFDLNPEFTENIKSDVPLPRSAVILPRRELVLATLFPMDSLKRARYRSKYVWQLGNFESSHRCPEHYRFPFADNVRAFAHVPDQQNSEPFTRYSVIFSLPVETKIVAIRGGTVVRVKKNNDLDILHNDSTIGSYLHLGAIEGGIVVGKSVSAGEVRGVAGRSEKKKESFVQITVWQPERLLPDSLFRHATPNLQPASVPLEFCSDAHDCRVLTQSQEVSGKTAKKIVAQKAQHLPIK